MRPRRRSQPTLGIIVRARCGRGLDAGGFDRHPGRGIAFQLDVEDAVGVLMQAKSLEEAVEEQL